MQQTAATFQNTMWRFMACGAQISTMVKNAVSLYEVLNTKPSMVDGDVVYPDEAHRYRKGIAIEFRWVMDCGLRSCLDTRLTAVEGT